MFGLQNSKLASSDATASETSTLLDGDTIKYEQEDGKWSDVPLEKDERKRWCRRTCLSSRMWVMIHLAVITIYTGLFITATTLSSLRRVPMGTLEISPARTAIQFREQYFDVKPEINDTYIGEPSDKLDENWHRLLQNTNIRITDSEFEWLNRPGIELPDGGYLAALNVYHELHCIKRLHRYMHKEHYFPNLNAHERHLNLLHSEHCLDILRQSIMCHADTSLITMRWGKSQEIPLANWTYPHQCVDWERLDTWAGSRAVNVFARNYLVHPQFGPAYPDGFNPTIGVVTED